MNLFPHILPTWFLLASLSFCVGTIVCRLWVLALPTPGDAAGNSRVSARLWSLLQLSIALIAVCSIADLVVRTAEMSGNPFGAVLPLLPAVVMKTHFGRIWLVRMAALALFAILVWTGRKYRDLPLFLSLLLFFAAVIAFTHSATGHAADSGDFSIAELMDLLHLAGSTVWAGGLFVLSLIVLPEMTRAGDQAAQPLAVAAARFSRIAGIAVAAIVVTSLYNAWVYVGSFGALFDTLYGKAITAKIILFILLLVLAAYNRYCNVPELQTTRQAVKKSVVHRIVVTLVPPVFRKSGREVTATRFLLSVRIEAILVLLLLLCVAVLRHEVPTRHHAHLDHYQSGGGDADHGGHGRHH